MLAEYLYGCLGIVLSPFIILTRLIRQEEHLKQENEENIENLWSIHEEGV